MNLHRTRVSQVKGDLGTASWAVHGRMCDDLHHVILAIGSHKILQEFWKALHRCHTLSLVDTNVLSVPVLLAVYTSTPSSGSCMACQ